MELFLGRIDKYFDNDKSKIAIGKSIIVKSEIFILTSNSFATTIFW